MAYGSILGQTVDIPDIPAAASQISYSNGSTSSIITSNNVQGAIDQLFTSVSNGKSQIASAITDKGVSTSASASFATMAANIAKISTGREVSIARISGSNNIRLTVPNYNEDADLYVFGYMTDTTNAVRCTISVIKTTDYGIYYTGAYVIGDNFVRYLKLSDCSISSAGRITTGSYGFYCNYYIAIQII